MTFYITDLMSLHDLTDMVNEGYVNAQSHPYLPLSIYNYSALAMVKSEWNDVTEHCRGLIVENGTGRIVARGPKKFWNYGQKPANDYPLHTDVLVTKKEDGCFLYNTKVNLWEGGTVKIGDIVSKNLDPVLVGLDDNGTLVPTRITNRFNNGPKKNWMSITVDNPVSLRSGSGAHPNRLKVTKNHHIYVNGDYIAAQEILPGDRLVTQTASIDPYAMKMIRDSLLGDGCVTTTPNGGSKYSEPHSIKQLEYVEYLRTTLGSSGVHRSNTVSGYGSTLVWAGSVVTKNLKVLRDEWYVDGKKIVPQDLTWMDDQTVAKWLMDDGCRVHADGQRDRILFSTNGFTVSDIERLGDRLKEMYGVSYALSEDKRGPNRGFSLRVNSGREDQIAILWERVSPYVHPSLRYKVPEKYRDVQFIPYTVGSRILESTESTVLSVEKEIENTTRNFPSGYVGFDIETETHNYMVNGVVVHNSLGIVWEYKGHYGVATRGSFTSDQAEHATKKINTNEYKWLREAVGWGGNILTPIVEIVYPSNRIVLDYGDRDELMPLGEVAPDGLICARGITGHKLMADADYMTLGEALALPIPDDEEGYVIDILGMEGTILEHQKLKGEEYLRKHRIVSKLSERSVWEAWMGGTYEKMLQDIPDEFHEWCGLVEELLTLRKNIIILEAATEFKKIEHLAEDRRSFAQEAKRVYPKRTNLLFLLLDGSIDKLHDSVMKSLKPKFDDPIVKNTEG